MFPHIGEVACGGREVLVVMEHNQAMLGCGGADKQIHGRQCTVGSLPQQAILRGQRGLLAMVWDAPVSGVI